MTKFYTTKEACEIAGIDRDRFNEMIASGAYIGAPATRVGATRFFDRVDLLQLVIFAQLKRGGFSARLAGIIAAQMRAGYEENPEAPNLLGRVPVEAREFEGLPFATGFTIVLNIHTTAWGHHG